MNKNNYVNIKLVCRYFIVSLCKIDISEIRTIINLNKPLIRFIPTYVKLVFRNMGAITTKVIDITSSGINSEFLILFM